MRRPKSVLLVERLRQEGLEIPEGARAVRTRRGRWQADAGAFSWILFDADGNPMDVGSESTMNECVRAKSLTFRLIPRTTLLAVYPVTRGRV